MHLIIFGIVILLALLSDTYIWLSFLGAVAPIWQVLHFVPTVGIVCLLVYMLTREATPRLFHAMFFLLFCIMLPKLLFTIMSLLGRGIGLLWSPAFSALNIVGLGLAIVLAVSAFIGLAWGWKHLVVKPQSITCNGLPSEFDGFKIVQLSDFHLETFANDQEFIEKVVRLTNEQKPDLIVFTGDMVTRQSKELEPFTGILSKLRARYGVLSILGNHDYAIYGPLRNNPQEREADKQQLVDMERQMGWTVLLNEHEHIHQGNADIAIIGVENEGKEGNIHRARLQEAMNSIPSNTFEILLSHDPEHWRNEIVPKTNIPLTLSGHTHAGHLRIGSFSPAKWMSGKEWGGLYKNGTQQLFVSAGIGGTLPFRLGAWPEINVITLHSSKN